MKSLIRPSDFICLHNYLINKVVPDGELFAGGAAGGGLEGGA